MNEARPVIEVRSVRVGRPAPLGQTAAGVEVLSAIVKAPVATATVALSTVNLDGDDQADRQVHGGPDKAVYVYSADHFATWNDELAAAGHDLVVGPGTFGENVTVVGVSEGDVGIGDRWSWGDAVLEVCQPRWPCFKLTMRTRVRDIGPRMRASGRTGWYLRVVTPGTVPTARPITVASRHAAGVTVRDAHRAQADRGRQDTALIDRVVAVDALAAEWRDPLR